jgi:hypothetical protein
VIRSLLVNAAQITTWILAAAAALTVAAYIP